MYVMKVRCLTCGHIRASHTTGIGDLDRCCFIPYCKCKQFEEDQINYFHISPFYRFHVTDQSNSIPTINKILVLYARNRKL